MSQFENVTLSGNANVYFDGKCISYTFHTASGERKSVGTIFPASLNFGTAAPELMEILSGECRVRLPGSNEWRTVKGGESFEVPGDSAFDIEVIERVDYACHYG